jgi:hypothetical protein
MAKRTRKAAATGMPPNLKLTATAEVVPGKVAAAAAAPAIEKPSPRVTTMVGLWRVSGLETMWLQSSKAERAQLMRRISEGE